MRTLLFLYTICAVLIVGQLPAHAGRQQSSSQQEMDPQFGPQRQKDPTVEKLERDREKALNKQRQASLQKDTDRLLELATELKQNVDKSNEHTLSLDVIRKAEEIEKLAKQVKDKMKGSY
jgi:hypothetical protein